MPDTTVKYFDSTMSGAPALSGTAETLIVVLDACLVNGFGSVTLNSLVITANVATATVSTGHNLAMVGNTGPVIKIEGATPSGLNGEWRITVTSGTVFTFTTSGISDQTATGTITAKRAPAGFSKAFSVTNKAVYRSDDITGTRLYLRVDDSTTTYATVRGYETMSDVDTGTGLFPDSGTNVYLPKSISANSTPVHWRIYTDSLALYVLINGYDQSLPWSGALLFGDIVSYKSADQYHCALVANTSQGANSASFLHQLNSTTASYLARSYSQTGGVILFTRRSHGLLTAMGLGGGAYPNPVDNLFHAWPCEVVETTGPVARGLLPGLWVPIHTSAPADGTVVSDIPQLPGRDLLVQTLSSSGRAAFDLTGPWR